MTILQIPLKEVLVDPTQDTDLTQVPTEEALRTLHQCYAFLSPDIDVTIQSGVARIAFENTSPRSPAQTKKLYDRAVTHAQRGTYPRAIDLFRSVIQKQPDHRDARRNLGMASLESGDVDQATKLVIQSIRLDPADSRAYSLLANIYLKHRRDYKTAERLYGIALRMSPDDPGILANLGSLYAQTSRPEPAAAMFDAAIRADPTYPNPYYGLALLRQDSGELVEALQPLQQMLALPPSPDIRSAPLYLQARDLYRELNQALCDETQHLAMGFVNAHKETLQQQTAIPIQLLQDSSLEVWATSEAAWRHDRTFHIIRYRSKPPQLVPHLLAHELEHLLMEQHARALGRNRFFATTPDTRDHAAQRLSKSRRQLLSSGLPPNRVDDYIQHLVTGLARQLYSIPIDMIIEHRIRQNYDLLAYTQFVSLQHMTADALQAFTSPDIKKTTPGPIFWASTALNCAYAILVDSLYQGATSHTEPYKGSTAYSNARRLHSLWRATLDTFRPGDEYELIDAWADALNLRQWYDWATDSHQATPTQGLTNPDLLPSKHPAAVMYCLSALERFAPMSLEDVRTITFEIALLGNTGLTYTSEEPKYTLRSVPGEHFSGLQLLCMMYVGFQRIDPAVDLHFDLAEPYHEALALHQSGT